MSLNTLVKIYEYKVDGTIITEFTVGIDTIASV